jgi:hypothetical protein
MKSDMKSDIKKASAQPGKSKLAPKSKPPAGGDPVQRALDEALRESFPASDPVAVSVAKPVADKVKKSGKKA